ncbi:hypothetical protein vBAmePPT11V19_00042 [Alteromonas phage vB_AmeP_PT11-V19]|nr:hypothetical protein vBAmePPT11V19_00042 [Alteromonas phage vB_AmeP_PT11-V19]
MRHLPEILDAHKTVAFDVETRSIYPKYEKEEAKQYLAENEEKNDTYRLAQLVVNSSGLSNPSIVRTTHFIIGVSFSMSYIFIATDEATELMIWKILSNYKGLMIIHNALFDLRIMFNRVSKMPTNIVDTSLLAKCFINHVNVWKAKVGLKDLMGEFYDPTWTKFKDYEPTDLKDPRFLEYAAIDGAATYHLHEKLNEWVDENDAV